MVVSFNYIKENWNYYLPNFFSECSLKHRWFDWIDNGFPERGVCCYKCRTWWYPNLKERPTHEI